MDKKSDSLFGEISSHRTSIFILHLPRFISQAVSFIFMILKGRQPISWSRNVSSFFSVPPDGLKYFYEPLWRTMDGNRINGSRKLESPHRLRPIGKRLKGLTLAGRAQSSRTRRMTAGPSGSSSGMTLTIECRTSSQPWPLLDNACSRSIDGGVSWSLVCRTKRKTTRYSLLMCDESPSIIIKK